MKAVVYTMVVVLGLAAFGCGPDKVTETLQDARFAVGGSVVYAGDTELAITDTAITITDLGGKTWEATSNSEGLWKISDLHEGSYVIEYVKDGYDPLLSAFDLNAVGENDFTDMYVGLGQTLMSETQLNATISAPFQVVLENGDFMAHGGPQVLRYSMSGDGLVTVDFNMPLYSGDFDVRMYNQESGSAIYATPDTGRMHWTFSAADIDTLFTGYADADPFSLHALQILGAWSYTEIHDDVTAVNAEIQFDVVN